MLEAVGMGALASGALVIGAVAGLWLRLPERVLATMLAFASGALITALTFELFEDSHEQGGLWRAALGMLAGAVVFVVLSGALDRWAGTGHPAEEDGSLKLDKDAATIERSAGPESTHGAAGLALLAGVTLDGLPENIALGVSLGEEGGVLALLAAIFISNMPEALVGSASMRAQGRSAGFVVGTWTGAALLTAFGVVIGAGPLAAADPSTISIPLAFAAGAVLASLADTLMPEAYEKGGPLVALSTTAGFVLSYLLSTI